MKKRRKPKKHYRTAKGGKKPKIKLPKEQGLRMALTLRHLAQKARALMPAPKGPSRTPSRKPPKGRTLTRRAQKVRLAAYMGRLLSPTQMVGPVRELTFREVMALNKYRRRHGQTLVSVSHAERLKAWQESR